MSDDIRPLLARLPEPAPPATLAATVMARIEQEAGRGRRPLEVAAGTRARFFWLYVLAGAVVVIGTIASGWASAGSVPDVLSSRIGNRSLVLLPIDGLALIPFAAGLLLYLAGLFAPLRR
jgi:hypothetical protein